jgi:hypothetical protein
MSPTESVIEISNEEVVSIDSGLNTLLIVNEKPFSMAGRKVWLIKFVTRKVFNVSTSHIELSSMLDWTDVHYCLILCTIFI